MKQEPSRRFAVKRSFTLLTFLVMTFFVAAYPAAAADAPSAAPVKKAAPAKDAAAPAKDAKSKEKEKEKGKLTPAEIAAFKEEQLKEINKQLHMVYVKGGCYEMGDFSGMGDDDELPVHEACVSDFYISDTEVTQGLWFAVMGYSFNVPFESDKPIENVSMLFVGKFVAKLNNLVKKYYRLPSEAEWEYAAREGGKKIRWSGTDNENEINDYAWFDENSDNAVHKVKQKKPNKLGLYDMTGNAWEWVDDYFDFDYYKTSPRKQPLGPASSMWRIIRGGSYMDDAIRSRTTYRYGLEPDQNMENVGFRIAE